MNLAVNSQRLMSANVHQHIVTTLVRQVIRNGLDLLGVSAPETM